MPIIETLIGSLIATLIGLGLSKNVESKTQPDGSVEVKKDGKVVATIPKIIDVRQEPLVFALVETDRASSSATARPDLPDISFTNPFKSKSTRLLSLGFIPNGTFKLQGVVEVVISGRKIVKSSPVGTYEDSSGINIPISENGLLMKGNESVEVRIWSGSGSVSLTGQAMFGDV